MPVGSVGNGTSWDLASSAGTVLDFEDLLASGPGYTTIPSYSGGGFTLVNLSVTAGSNDAFASPQSDNASYQGSTALANNRADGVTMLTKDGGATFTLGSIDVAELFPSNPSTGVLTFTGTRADGTTVTSAFTMDGMAGFQTFTFEGFKNLVSVTWVQSSPYHQFDNIVLDPVTVSPQSVGPKTKDDCFKGGWARFGFRNQGQCIRMVETGKGGK